jgi:hypothetical protein
MMVGKAEQGTMQKLARQDDNQGGCYYAHPAVEQFLADKVYRDKRQSAQNSRHVSAHHLDGMLRRCSPADKQGNASDKPGKEWPGKSSPTIGVEHVGVKGIEVGKVMNHILYMTNVIIGISLPEPDPTIDENLVMRQVYAYIQRDATEDCYDYAHYSCWGKPSFLS